MKSEENSHELMRSSLAVKKLVSFESRAQIDLIKRAAMRRGLSFSAFVRMISAGVAVQVLELPSEAILGELLERGISSLSVDNHL